MTNEDDTIDPIDQCLDEFEARREEGDLDGARAALERAAGLAGADDPDVRLAAIELAFDAEGPDTARALAQALVADEPDHPDAWYALGRLLAEAGETRGAIECFSRVAQIDSELETTLPPIERAVLDRIERIARDVVERLPPELGRLLVDVPIVLEERPPIDLVRQGFDPRSFGLFEGNEEGPERHPVPTRIVLYTSCLVDAFGEDEVLDEEVEVTVLHELGHFFHLDEDDVARLGLA